MKVLHNSLKIEKLLGKSDAELINSCLLILIDEIMCVFKQQITGGLCLVSRYNYCILRLGVRIISKEVCWIPWTFHPAAIICHDWVRLYNGRLLNGDHNSAGLFFHEEGWQVLITPPQDVSGYLTPVRGNLVLFLSFVAGHRTLYHLSVWIVTPPVSGNSDSCPTSD